MDAQLEETMINDHQNETLINQYIDIKKVKLAITKGKTTYQYFLIFFIAYISIHCFAYWSVSNQVNFNDSMPLVYIFATVISAWGMLISLGRCTHLQGQNWMMWCGGTILLLGIPALIAVFSIPLQLKELEAKIQR